MVRQLTEAAYRREGLFLLMVSEGFQLNLSYPSSLSGLTPVPGALPPPQSCSKTVPEPKFLCRHVSGVPRMASHIPGTQWDDSGSQDPLLGIWEHQPPFFAGLSSSRRQASNVNRQTSGWVGRWTETSKAKVSGGTMTNARPRQGQCKDATDISVGTAERKVVYVWGRYYPSTTLALRWRPWQ